MSTCNRTEIYCRADDVAVVRELAERRGRPLGARYRAPSLLPPRTRGRPPRLPRRLGPGLDGAGRAADPRAGEAVRAHRRAQRHAGLDPEPPLPADLLGGEGGAHAHGHRRAVDLDVRGGAQARAEPLRRHLAHEDAADRRGRDGGARRHLLRRAGSAVGGRRQPHARARRGLRRALQRHRHRPRAAPRAPARVRHRHHRHRLDAAHPLDGRLRARAQGPPLPPDVRGGLRRAARRGARGRGARGPLPLHHRRPRHDRPGGRRPAAGRGRRSRDHRRPAGRGLPGLAQAARERRAGHRAAARQGRRVPRRRARQGEGSASPGARIPRRCSRGWRAAW